VNKFEERIRSHAQSIKKCIASPVNIEGEGFSEMTKQKKVRANFVLVAALIVMLGTVTAFAAVNFDVLKEFFIGDFSAIQTAVKSPRERISDEDFALTLEEVLTDNHYLFMAYSVEGLTDKAIEELMGADDLLYDNEFQYKINISPSPGVSIAGNTYFSAHSREIVEKRTATTRYWVYYDEMENVSKEALTLRLDAMSEDKYIAVPTDCNVDTRELLLTGQTYGDVSVHLSPIGIVLEKGAKTIDISDTTLTEDFPRRRIRDAAFTEVFFRMSDGSIKTYNQLADSGSVGSFIAASGREMSTNGIGYMRFKYGTRFFDTMPLSEFESIIVGNIEYDINDPLKTNSVTIDESMYPLEAEGLILADENGEGIETWFLAEELFNQLGANMTWENGEMTVEYRGSVAKITDMPRTYKRDGKPVNARYVSPEYALFRMYEGELYVARWALAEVLRVGISEDYNTVECIEEPIENDGVQVGAIRRPITPQHAKYHIIP